MKITIEEEGKKPVHIETDSFFFWHDKGAMWKGVDTHISTMLEIYSEKVIKERREAVLNDKS